MMSETNETNHHRNDGNSSKRLARRLRRHHYMSIEPQTLAPVSLPSPEEAHAHAHIHKHPAPAEAERVAEHLREQLARLQAEFDNYRKRQRRDEQQHLEQANQKLIEQLLPVLDNFNRALASPGDSVQSLLSGLSLVQKQLVDLLTQNGLEKLDPLGQPFDPNVHEAVCAEPAAGKPDNQVTGVFQDGYTLKGRLLRPAMVKVARNG